MRLLAVLSILLAVACAPQTREELTRGAARAAVKPVVAVQFPNVPSDEAADCVLDNATATELSALAADAVTGPTASTYEKVEGISNRAATRACIAEQTTV